MRKLMQGLLMVGGITFPWLGQAIVPDDFNGQASAVLLDQKETIVSLVDFKAGEALWCRNRMMQVGTVLWSQVLKPQHCFLRVPAQEKATLPANMPFYRVMGLSDGHQLQFVFSRQKLNVAGDLVSVRIAFVPLKG